MIRFLDFLTPFINEIFRARQSRANKRPPGVYKRVFVYVIVATSILGNYFLVKKVYSLTLTAYTYKEKYKETQNFPLLLGACEDKNNILVGIIDGKLAPSRPIKRPADAKVDTLSGTHVNNTTKAEAKTTPAKTTPKSKNDLDGKSRVQVQTTEKDSSSDKLNARSTIEQRRERMIEAQEKSRETRDRAAAARQEPDSNWHNKR